MVCKYFSYLVGYLFTLDIIFWCIVFVCFLLILKKYFYLFLFLVVSSAFGVLANKSAIYSIMNLWLCFLLIILVLGLTFRSLIHFWVVLYSVSDPFSFSCMGISSFPSCVYHPCKKLLDHTCEHLFLDCFLSHWSVCLSLRQYHAVLITVAW